jgi:protein-tyrosine phosphatase
MFREVQLTDVEGRLLLHSMPGRYEEFVDCLDEMNRRRVSAIVALPPKKEIAEKSVHYAHAITALESRLPQVIHVPVEDFSVPTDGQLEEFFAAAGNVAQLLRDGGTVLVHCGAGHGRTGMFASVVLLRLGYHHAEALRRVEEAGSGPETPAQRELVRRAAEGRPE